MSNSSAHIVKTEKRDGASAAWISDELLPADRLKDHVRGLASAFPDTGLWPMRADGLGGKLERPPRR